jgi:hypothetical protein
MNILDRWLVRHICNLVLVACLAACATPPFINIKAPTNESGVVVIAVGTAIESQALDLHLSIRDVNRKLTQSFRYLRGTFLQASTEDFAYSQAYGTVIAYRLLPGEYEIFNFNLTHLRHYHRARRDFSLRFVVEKGKTTYLGEYISHAKQIRGTNGLSPIQYVHIVVQDQQERDLRIVGKRIPEAATNPVIRSVMDRDSVLYPLIRTKPIQWSNPTDESKLREWTLPGVNKE